MQFEIKGKPVAKARPRVGKFGTYTPQKTVNYENLINYTFTQKYPDFKPFEGEIKVKITAIFEVPKSYSKKKREMLLPDEFSEHGMGYKGKVDIDNICKSVLDALNGIAYKDDSQITCLLAFKEYGIQAKTIIEIEEIGDFI